MDTLFIVIPAYNEEKNIKSCIEAWYPVVEKHNSSGNSKLIIIDDGSKDKTCSILSELAQTRPYLLPLTKDNEGHGPTVLYGYKYAVEHGADFVFQTDSDGQTLPTEFEEFWCERNNFDAVLGRRCCRGDGFCRLLVQKTVCLLLLIIFGVRVPDANAPFRLMKTSLLAKYIDKLPSNFNIPNIMFTAYFVYHREKVLFKSITFRPRQGGKNSINFVKIFKIGWRAVQDFLRLRKDM